MIIPEIESTTGHLSHHAAAKKMRPQIE